MITVSTEPDISADQAATSTDLGEIVGRELSTAIVVFHEAVGRKLGLSATERKILDVLTRIGPSTAGQLAEHTGLTSGAITGIVNRLARAGYVGRDANPTDRRSVIVSRRSSPRLNRIRPEIFGPLGEAITDLSAKYTQAELGAIASYLTALTEILREQTERISTIARPGSHQAGRDEVVRVRRHSPGATKHTPAGKSTGPAAAIAAPRSKAHVGR
jgi:DNA-binding Lrp family transcriptional regulator